MLNAASASLTLNTATSSLLEDLERAKNNIILQEARVLAASGDPKAAEAKIEEYRAAGGNSYSSRKLARKLMNKSPIPTSSILTKSARNMSPRIRLCATCSRRAEPNI